MEDYDKDCIFCKIIRGEVASKKVYEDEYVYAFEDIAKLAKHHILIVPKKHIVSLEEVDFEKDMIYMGKILEAAQKIARIIGEEKQRIQTCYKYS